MSQILFADGSGNFSDLESASTYSHIVSRSWDLLGWSCSHELAAESEVGSTSMNSQILLAVASGNMACENALAA